jgi:2-dehydro-3-deoxy-D-arabinonate dehydratase
LTRDGAAALALWRGGALLDLSTADTLQLRTLDELLSLPLEQVRSLLEEPRLDALPSLDPSDLEWLAPAEGQEVWAAGVTYLRSRQARLEEAAARDVYTRVYEAERPELFFKAAGWRVVAHGGAVGVRSDSDWNVPEPELVVLSNAHGEVVAYSCGNDMSSRSIEGENPLYLPQAKVYDASCSIGPAAALAWNIRPSECSIQMTIERDGQEIFSNRAAIRDMVRDPAELVGVLHAAYTLPVGAWLMTGTSIVPDRYTATPGDIIHINIEGIGELRNTIKRVEYSGAKAPPRLH